MNLGTAAKSLYNNGPHPRRCAPSPLPILGEGVGG